MDDLERRAKCNDMQSRYKNRVKTSVSPIGERMSIIEHLADLHLLVQPEQIIRPTKAWIQSDDRQDTLGRFRDPAVDRKSITTDLDLIQFFRNELQEDPPSFIEAGPRRELYFDPTSVKVGILTSGGIAPGLNTVVEAIVENHVSSYGLRLAPLDQGKILGFRHGLLGLETDDCTELSPHSVAGWFRSGASKLGVGRGSTDVNEWIRTLRKHSIDILYIVGGNGSLTAGRKLADAIKSQGLSISVAVIPKTMDNDILWVWQSFGFASAFDKATEIINILHTEAESTARVCVVQLFGAKSGHVAANAALASGEVDAVLIPEVNVKTDLLTEFVKNRVARNGHALVVMAEAATIIGETGDKWPVQTREQREENFLKVQSVLSKGLEDAGLGANRVFLNQPQHLIRSVAPNAHDQVFCRRLGDLVVDNTLGGYTNFMISSWLNHYCLVPLVFSAKEGLTPGGYKTFPGGGVFWRTVRRSTGQPSFE
jgi:6-phosphofructokinase 1